MEMTFVDRQAGSGPKSSWSFGSGPTRVGHTSLAWHEQNAGPGERWRRNES